MPNKTSTVIPNLKEESNRKKKEFDAALKDLTKDWKDKITEFKKLFDDAGDVTNFLWWNRHYYTPLFGDTKTVLTRDATIYNPIPISDNVLGEKDKGICLKLLDKLDELFNEYFKEYKNLREEYENLAANETLKDSDLNHVDQVIAVAEFFSELDGTFITRYGYLREMTSEAIDIIVSEAGAGTVVNYAFPGDQVKYMEYFKSNCVGEDSNRNPRVANCGLAGVAYSEGQSLKKMAKWLIHLNNIKNRIDEKIEQLGKFKEILTEYNIAKKKFDNIYKQARQRAAARSKDEDKGLPPPPSYAEAMSDKAYSEEIEAIKRKLQLIDEQYDNITKQEEAINKELEVTNKQIDDKIARLKALSQKSKTKGLTAKETQEMNILLGGVPEGGRKRRRKIRRKTKRRRRRRTKRRKVSKKSRKRRRRRTRK